MDGDIYFNCCFPDFNTTYCYTVFQNYVYYDYIFFIFSHSVLLQLHWESPNLSQLIQNIYPGLDGTKFYLLLYNVFGTLWNKSGRYTKFC